LFVPMLGAGYKLHKVLASAVVTFLQRGTTRMANAYGWFLVAKAQGCSIAVSPVTCDIAEVYVTHPASFVAAWISKGAGLHDRQSRHPCETEL
jgi:hypothetical protein